MTRQKQQGFNLIELLVIVALIGFLLSFGVPAMTQIIANGRVRTAAEGVVNGMQVARAEAVRRNTIIALQLGTDGISWDVVSLDATLTPVTPSIQTRPAEGGTSINYTGTTVTVLPLPGTSTLTAPPAAPPMPIFNGWGTVTVNGTTPLTYAMSFSSSVAGTRRMCAVIVANTPKLCDPQRTDLTDPQACAYISDSTTTPVTYSAIPGC